MNMVPACCATAAKLCCHSDRCSRVLMDMVHTTKAPPMLTARKRARRTAKTALLTTKRLIETVYNNSKLCATVAQQENCFGYHSSKSSNTGKGGTRTGARGGEFRGFAPVRGH